MSEDAAKSKVEGRRLNAETLKAQQAARWRTRLVTARDYWAVRAPEEIPSWFEPVMETERPEEKSGFRHSVTGEYRAVIYDNEFESMTEEESNCWDSIPMLILEWGRKRREALLSQWPWAWADLMLKAGEVVR